jgi:hypothetical protein
MNLRALAFFALSLVIAASARGEDPRKFFENEIRPLLSKHCFECHGEKKQKGGLRVDHITYLKTGGDTGPAVVPGDPDKSPLIEAVRQTNEDFKMPPRDKLSDTEIAALEKWVRLGAAWPVDDKKVVVTEGGFTEEQRNYWFFKPLGKPVPPEAGGAWAKNEIDRFIAAKHAELKLTPAPEADRQEFIRRATFDLHGLPPSPAEINAFLNDPSPSAHETLINRLLESPRYGERWAQHWLDLTRYAESDGYNQDAYRPNVWPYRDWVIESLNADKPYDRFVREQLAGDEIAPNDPKVLTATQYLRLPIYEYNQRDVAGQWDIILTDITDTSGELFLGLSYGCAHCHNHKFDPILQKDYYRLRAFFAPVKWRDDLTLGHPQEKAEHQRKQAAWEEATASIRKEMDEILKPLLAAKAKSATRKFNDDLQAIINKPEPERAPLEKQYMVICDRQIRLEQASAAKSIKDESVKKRFAELETELKQFDHLKPTPLQEAFVATDVGPAAPPVLMKTRKGEQDIAPGFLTLLEPDEPAIKPLPDSTGRRTVLADWITRPSNQLSTRVIVNRVWQYHFGRGIVATSSDFGKLGETPSHPELLDWLAQRFVADGWSLKKLHREMMLSATYRQTARIQPSATAAVTDPSNRYLWRFNPRRLDAEQVRDAMLAASGELDLKAGGPAEAGTSLRRSIYTMKKRNNQTEILRALDAPAGFSSTAERQSTTTPTQALLLVNGEWPLQRARKLAEKASSIDDAWIRALGRPPTAAERETADQFLRARVGTLPPALTEAGSSPAGGEFKENTPHERVLVETPGKEGDDFTIEAVAQLDSIDANAAVRTLASRWSGGKDSVESFGWSLGVTGEKSRFKPRNIIIQLVGEDENSNIAYEVVPSNIRFELGHRHHIAARISLPEHSATFNVLDLDNPKAAPQTATVPLTVRSKLTNGSSGIVIGGLHKRNAPHHWDGRIEALRIIAGTPSGATPTPDHANWKDGFIQWAPTKTQGPAFTWNGADSKVVEPTNPFRQAMNDLCQMLLNTNEFFYLH